MSSSLRQSRTAALVAVLITGLAAVYALALLLGADDPSWAHLPRGIIHLGELAALVALALSGAAGAGRLARVGLGPIGLGAAGLGEILLAVAEVITASNPGTSNALFLVGPNLVGLGLILAGVAIVRTGRWTGWRRWVVLALGIYVFAVMTPVIIASGGPPAAASLGVLVVWEILWALIAVSVLAETARARSGAEPVAG